MNIFVLDLDPVVAARMAFDAHVGKMALECAQMLSVPFGRPSFKTPMTWAGVELPPRVGPYGASQANKPPARWVRATSGNYAWTVAHALALLEEHTYRHGTPHATLPVVLWCRDHVTDALVPAGPMTPFAQTMPDQYRVEGDAVAAYRAYYHGDKDEMARWTRRGPPAWWTGPVLE